MAKKTVLIVDDFQVSVEMISQALIKKGYEILTTNNGQQAYEHFKHSKIDLILSDYHMPGLNGIELVKLIRQENKRIPFLLFSSDNKPELKQEARLSGATGWIPKPINEDKIIQIIQRLI